MRLVTVLSCCKAHLLGSPKLLGTLFPDAAPGYTACYSGSHDNSFEWRWLVGSRDGLQDATSHMQVQRMAMPEFNQVEPTLTGYWRD